MTEPLEFWAFWGYDQFPYMLSGKIDTFVRDGEFVTVKTYGGMQFKPMFVTQGEHGRKLHVLVCKLSAAYVDHINKARRAAIAVAYSSLVEAGMPAPLVHKDGVAVVEYTHLFKELMQ